MSAAAGARVARLSAPLANASGAALLLGLSAWLWIGAAEIEVVGGGGLGPSDFPRLVAALLAVCSAALLVQSLRAVLARSDAVVLVSRPFQVLAAIVLVCLYPPLIGWLGYYVATPLWMVPLLLLAGMRNPFAIVASAAGFLLFARVMFQMVLGIPMP